MTERSKLAPYIPYRWDHHFLNLCLEHAKMSKDPNTRVGAVIVGPDVDYCPTHPTSTKGT